MTALRFAIAGAGVAGSYLGNMLQKRGHDVEIFEASKPEGHWPVCAWGASRHMLSKFSEQAGLDFEKYIMHVGQRLRMDLPAGKVEHLRSNFTAGIKHLPVVAHLRRPPR